MQVAQQISKPVSESVLHTPEQHVPLQKPVLPRGPATTSSRLVIQL